MKLRFDKIFHSDLLEAKKAALEALAFLREGVPGAQDDKLSDLKLVFNELLVNAVLHGNMADISKTVRLEVEASDEGMFARITDEGVGFDHRGAMQKRSDDGLFDDHGRGVTLAYHMTDMLFFSESGNVIEFTKRLVE